MIEKQVFKGLKSRAIIFLQSLKPFRLQKAARKLSFLIKILEETRERQKRNLKKNSAYLNIQNRDFIVLATPSVKMSFFFDL